MEEIPKKENVLIKVQFEYLNDNDILDLSKEYTINISLLENTDFEINKAKIISNSDFKTEKERKYFHMFNKTTKKFFTKNSDFIPFIKTNSSIILINCYEYAEKVIKKLNEELQNINQTLESNFASIEIRKKELELVLSTLENNLQIDIFAEEFIYKKGIEYLVFIIKRNNNGNIRMYSLQDIKQLLSYQNAFDFFDKNKNLLSILYDIFIGNNENNCVYLLFDIIVELIGGNEEKIMNLIEKIDEDFYQKLISYLSVDNKQDNIIEHTLLFINMILNFSSPNKHFDLLFNLTKEGLFENLDKIVKNKENHFLEHLELLENSVQKILNEADKNNENYNGVNDKFIAFVENKKIYHIQHLIKGTKDKDDKIKKNAGNELTILLKDKKYMNIFYESFMKNENIDILNLYYDYIISYIISKEDKTLNFINSAKDYAKKTNTKIFIQITNYLDIKNKDEIKTYSLLFINKILSFSNKNIKLEILYYFIDAGILDLLYKLNKVNEDFSEQLQKFKSLIEQILEQSNKEDEKYQIIKQKYDKFVEDKIYCEIKDRIIQYHNSLGTKQELNSDELVNSIKEKNAYKILYNLFMDNNNNNLAFSFFDIFVKIFGESQETIMLFIDIAQQYAEKNNTKIFNKILYYITEKNTNEFVKGQAIQIINMIINFSAIDKQYKLLTNFEEQGIFEILNNLIKCKDLAIKAQMKLFLNFVKQILKNSNKNDVKYNVINNKYKKLLEDKKFYEKTLNDFVLIDEDEFENL